MFNLGKPNARDHGKLRLLVKSKTAQSNGIHFLPYLTPSQGIANFFMKIGFHKKRSHDTLLYIVFRARNLFGLQKSIHHLHIFIEMCLKKACSVKEVTDHVVRSNHRHRG